MRFTIFYLSLKNIRIFWTTEKKEYKYRTYKGFGKWLQWKQNNNKPMTTTTTTRQDKPVNNKSLILYPEWSYDIFMWFMLSSSRVLGLFFDFTVQTQENVINNREFVFDPSSWHSSLLLLDFFSRLLISSIAQN